LLALALLAAGCTKNVYEGHGVRWEPPRGVTLQHELDESEGVNLEFSGGVQLALLGMKEHGLPETVSDDGLDELAQAVSPSGAKVISKRTGKVPAGAVARFVWLQGASKTCLYYLPYKDQALMLSLTAPSASFGVAESQFDLSMSKLSLQ